MKYFEYEGDKIRIDLKADKAYLMTDNGEVEIDAKSDLVINALLENNEISEEEYNAEEAV